MQKIPALLLCAALMAAAPLCAQVTRAVEPDPRMKADILLVVAHPDDETAIGGYLARAVYDLGKKVAIIYCNRGTGGGNSAGGEQSVALGEIREIEARRADASLGITNVWFLNGRDTPGQDLFQSLEAWHHGAVLEEVVRLVRLTRPEVIITWLPHVDAGEDHGDHQASGVIAVEAFDCAGDPTVFPAQVTPPRERGDIAQVCEGLHPWQAKKLYFFGNPTEEIRAAGPRFDINEVSPSKHEPYYRLALPLHAPHLTQADVSQAALDAAKSGDYGQFKGWLEKIHLLFGKSVVPASPAGDVFEGIAPAPVQFVRAPGFTPVNVSGVTIELGAQFAFYRDFWRAHGIERVAGIVPDGIEASAGSYLYVPLLIRNGTSDSVTVDISSSLPEGWKEASGSGAYRVGPGTDFPVQAFVRAPGSAAPNPAPVTWNAAVKGTKVGSATLGVKLVEWALPW
ncbi:MAG TPA: PIG-L family deacetylase [Bacteroidota bacterium]|nr:PIG-L family deacetylase [Bacteroidota bacterium]